jgi:hypothetical protein
MFCGGFKIDSGWIDSDAGSRHDLETPSALLHVVSCNPAFAADDCIDLRDFFFPAFRLGPGIDYHDLGPGSEPLEHIGLKFFYQYST